MLWLYTSTWRSETPPRPSCTENWLIIFVAHENGNGKTVPVGIYEHADLKLEYSDRPDGLRDDTGSICKFCASTEAKDAYLIPLLKRKEFALPVEATNRFTRTFAYARGRHRAGKEETWRLLLAQIADNILLAKNTLSRIR